MIARIVSGGQTGVDRAALDLALELGLPLGGWCPAGRRAEDGTLPDHYPLQETPSADPAQRTAWNVRDADATLVLVREPPAGGTALAVRVAGELGRPCRVATLGQDPPASVRDWLEAGRIGVLNVAGPRESEAPGIREEALGFLRRVLAAPQQAR